MTIGTRLSRLAIAAVVLACGCRSVPTTIVRNERRLGMVRITTLHRSSGGVVFIFSDTAGWTPPLDDVARRLAAAGAVTVGIDLPSYLRNLRQSPDGCHYVVAELEDLSHRLERELNFVVYRAPLLAGVGAGATLAYAALSQAPAATLGGAAGIDPAPTLDTRVPLCPGAAATEDPAGGFRYAMGHALPAPWRVGKVEGGDIARSLVALVRPMLSAPTTSDAIAAALPELPLVVLPASPRGPLAAIIYSGDGGWRDLDKTIGETLAGRGVPVIGVDSLRYFWDAKTPERVAADLGAIMTAAHAAWGDVSFVLVGYSFGAGILPFAVNRLSAAERDHIVEISLLGLEPRAPFEIEVTGILGRAPSADAALVAPEVQRLDASLVQCFYGEEESTTLCRDPVLSTAELVRTKGSHHFDGNYVALADRILAGAERRLTARRESGAASPTPRPLSGG